MSFGNPQILSSSASSVVPTPTGPSPTSNQGLLPIVARTPPGGVPLINGTQTILSLTTPNDGQQHLVAFGGGTIVSSVMTGGAIQFATGNLQGGVQNPIAVDAGGRGGNTTWGLGAAYTSVVLVDANTACSIKQSSALTAGGASAIGHIAVLT